MSYWLKKKLSKLSIPPYDEQRYRETIANAKKIQLHSDIRMSGTEFFLDQIRFIRKPAWILKMVWIVFVIFLVSPHSMGLDTELFSLFAIGSPLLFLMNTRDIYSICMPDLVELHLSARNSITKLLFVRLLLFGIIDLICLAVTSFFASASGGACIWQIILYGCVPYNLACLGCLHIMNRREEDVLLYCVSYSVFLSLTFTIFKRHGEIIYAGRGIVIWFVAGIFITIGLYKEFNKMIVYGRENLNGINIGRTV